jgi:SAM-dependent methyltransferase
MDPRTRNQLRALSDAFYRAHADAFDASRGQHAWPGWQRLLEWLPSEPARNNTSELPLTILDIGCGNARFAHFVENTGRRFHYIGVDANADLLAAGRERLKRNEGNPCQLIEQDFLASDRPGEALPTGPFDLIAIMGVVHHVPGHDWRLRLLQAAADRLTNGGILALAAWQFADRTRFARRRVAWSDLGPVHGEEVNTAHLEEGDLLLRFGDDPTRPPRYCHQVSGAEFESWPDRLGLTVLADYRADGAQGDLNRYWILQRASADSGES